LTGNGNRPAYIVMRGIISPECIAVEGPLIIAAAFAPIPAPASADGWRVDQVDGHKADQLDDDRYRPTTPHTPTTPPAYAPR
jgi:hypothetical protein